MFDVRRSLTAPPLLMQTREKEQLYIRIQKRFNELGAFEFV